MIIIKEQLQFLRKKKGLTQADVAKIIDVQLSTYQKYERDVISPTYDKLIKLAKFYNVTTDYLLGIGAPPDPLSQLTEEELEQKLIEGYFKLPKEYRKAFLQSLREAVAECKHMPVEEVKEMYAAADGDTAEPEPAKPEEATPSSIADDMMETIIKGEQMFSKARISKK